MLHVNHAWEPHINQDSHTECCMFTMYVSHTLIKIPSHFTHTLSQKMIKNLLENLCTLVATLHTIKSVTNAFISGVKRAKKKRNSYLWEVCFSQQMNSMPHTLITMYVKCIDPHINYHVHFLNINCVQRTINRNLTH